MATSAAPWISVGIFGGDGRVPRHEDVVDGVDVGLGRRAAMSLRPGRATRGSANSAAMCGRFAMPIGPRASSIVIVDAELGESLDECAHRRERAVVDDRARPVEDDRLHMRAWPSLVLAVQSKSSAITSSAMAKEVLAPVPLVMITMRTPSAGASTSTRRSGADA